MKRFPFAKLDVDTWPRERFLAVLFAVLLACAWMVASATAQHSSARRRYFVGEAQRGSVSPVPYHADLSVAARVGGESDAPLRLLVRADTAAGAEELCPLAAAEPGLAPAVRVTWFALGGGEAACAPAGRVVRAAGPAADPLRAALRDARWVLVDGRDRALYSRRTVPGAGEIRRLAALLSPAAGEAGR